MIQGCFGDHISTPCLSACTERKVGAAAPAAQVKKVWSLDGIVWEFHELCELKRSKHAFKVLFILSSEAFIADIYHHSKDLQRAERVTCVLCYQL